MIGMRVFPIEMNGRSLLTRVFVYVCEFLSETDGRTAPEGMKQKSHKCKHIQKKELKY